MDCNWNFKNQWEIIKSLTYRVAFSYARDLSRNRIKNFVGKTKSFQFFIHLSGKRVRKFIELGLGNDRNKFDLDLLFYTHILPGHSGSNYQKSRGNHNLKLDFIELKYNMKNNWIR